MIRPDTSTRLYCILGSPVSHSRSPVVHNQAFCENEINAVYLAFEPPDIGSGVEAMRALNIQGASITIPFKESIIPHLDFIDDEALKIGAVNTVVNGNGILKGYNTDSKAAVDLLKVYGIKGRRILILGAGGAAKAVAFGVSCHSAHIMIANRTSVRGKTLANRFGIEFVLWDDIPNVRPDIVINTTSVGMSPNTELSPYPEFSLRPEMIIMDMVYTPLNTKLLSMARKRGCRTIDGLSLFLAQGAAQFKLWTGHTPDFDKMRPILSKDLE